MNWFKVVLIRIALEIGGLKLEAYRSSNSMMEMYTEGHELIKHGKETYGVGHELERYRWIGVTDDAWGFPSYRWVHEEHTQEEWLERIAPILH